MGFLMHAPAPCWKLNKAPVGVDTAYSPGREMESRARSLPASRLGPALSFCDCLDCNPAPPCLDTLTCTLIHDGPASGGSQDCACDDVPEA